MRFSPLQVGHRPHAKEAIMQPIHRLQRNLFEDHRKTLHIPAALRSVIVRLLENLLVEALTGRRQRDVRANHRDEGGRG
jgi:hypothetical protein